MHPDEHERPPIRRERRTDWRLGGRSVHKWDARVLVVALACLGIGVIAAIVMNQIPARWASIASLVTLWLSLLVAVAYPLLRSRPMGLFEFRFVDVVWGLGFGISLRLVQGMTQGANVMPFPGSAALSNKNSVGWWFDSVIGPGLVGPVVEELFFRGVLVVVIYQLLRRGVGPVAAALTATLVSAGAFVLLHGLGTPPDLAGGMMLASLGVVCASLILTTGRIWGAVATHIVYNAVFLIIIFLGAGF